MPEVPAVALDHVDVAYPNSPAVLTDVHLTVPAGEHVAVIGRSGCGKSTLLHLVAGLLEPARGTVRVRDGSGADARLAHCALMPQGDSLLPWFSVRDNVAVPLRNRGVGRRAARERATETLAWCGLEHHARHRPDQLSGGMRQRAALARALLADKPVLLADEPLGALDAITRAEIQDWLHGVLSTTDTTMVMVTHDVDEALLLSHRVVLVADGGVEPAGRSREGWFDRRRGRAREDVLADPGFAAARSALLRELAGGA
ncbi:ABC transporter ATP-binding protein [Corynebacterium sp. AOP36-E1-14]|uniref:ABC transporter ATP-binding protein n=1 Tax=unclassified Corynebacterium TaxID=2624378 RepID=UPI00265439D3|nr:ATP-binding cassette domain-containing protein [Corynebacterium sp.]